VELDDSGSTLRQKEGIGESIGIHRHGYQTYFNIGGIVFSES